MTELNASGAAEPISDERLAEIREAARPGHAAILAQLIKHGAHDLPERGKVIVHGCTVVPVADLKTAVKTVWFGTPDLLAEVERLRAADKRVRELAAEFRESEKELLERHDKATDDARATALLSSAALTGNAANRIERALDGTEAGR